MNPDKNQENIMYSHEQEADNLFEESKKNKIIQEIKKDEKTFQQIMEENTETDKAFEKELDTIACSDERVSATEGVKLGIAGQLILASEEEVENFINANKGKIKKVESHYNCGAANEKFKILKNSDEWNTFKSEHGLEGEKVEDAFQSADDLGKRWSMYLAERLADKSGQVVKYSHTSESKMRQEVHNARAICFDGTGRFNSDVIEDMPVHYSCHAPGFGLSDGYCQKELEILSSIAFKEKDGHGFGKRLTEDDKFYIFISAKDDDQMERLTEIAEKATKDYGSRVEIQGFVHKV